MRCMQRIALLIFPLILSVASLAEAQSSVAIVDIGMVFKAHPTFPRGIRDPQSRSGSVPKERGPTTAADGSEIGKAAGKAADVDAGLRRIPEF